MFFFSTDYECHFHARSSHYVFHVLFSSPSPSYLAVEDQDVLPRLASIGIATPMLAIVNSEYNHTISSTQINCCSASCWCSVVSFDALPNCKYP